MLKTDIGYDLKPKINNKNKFIFVIGLPKSGTTLIEEILYNIGYVDLSTSPLRFFDNRNLKNNHDISEEMFNKIPKGKYTFLKLHTHYSQRNLEVILKFSPKVIISKRSLRDALISRYCHVISDKNHRHHNLVKNLSYDEGFKKSIIINNETDTPERPLDYFYNWTKDWLKIIEEKKLNYLILDFDEIKSDKFEYIKKILNYLNITEYSPQDIIFKLDKNLKEIEKNSLGKNFNNFIKPKTFNKKSNEIKQSLNLKEIESFIKKNLPKNY